MPFCNQCGTAVSAADTFCFRCGKRQPVEARPRAGEAPPPGSMTPRTASILCYVPVIGWVACIVVLASQRFRLNRTVRFNAFQGLYLFVAWLLVDWVIRPMMWLSPHFHVSGILKLVLFGMSILMIVKTSHEESYSLPVFGELAQRSIAED